MVVTKRAAPHTAHLSSGVSASDVNGNGGDMETWNARAAARVSGTRTRVMVMGWKRGDTRWLLKYVAWSRHCVYD